MKKAAFLLLTVAIFAHPAEAQLTITADDYAQAHAIGSQVWAYQGTEAAVLDVGAPGENTWDFAHLPAQLGLAAVIMDPAPTPYADLFPHATHVFVNNLALSFESWTYTALEADQEEMLGTVVNTQVRQETRTIYQPPDRTLQFPLTPGTTWTNTSTAFTTSENAAADDTVRVHYDEMSAVDAFGVMTLPDGQARDALRIHQRVTTIKEVPGLPADTAHVVVFTFLAADGVTVSVTAQDTTQGDSGPITGIIAWSRVDAGAVGVEAEPTLPALLGLALHPNPFAGATVLSFNLPAPGPVVVDVYDLLGRRLRNLAEGPYAAGPHTVRWDGLDAAGNPLPAGLYLYRLAWSGRQTGGAFVKVQ